MKKKSKKRRKFTKRIKKSRKKVKIRNRKKKPKKIKRVKRIKKARKLKAKIRLKLPNFTPKKIKMPQFTQSRKKLQKITFRKVLGFILDPIFTVFGLFWPFFGFWGLPTVEICRFWINFCFFSMLRLFLYH